jgi:competence protein ComEA
MSNNCKNGGFMNNRPYNKGLAIVLIIAFLIMAALGIKLSGKEEEIVFNDSENNENGSNEIIGEDPEESIFVDIDGEVMNPGVYQLESGDRVNDAIIVAGGLTDNACTKNLNKARKLSDGEKIYISSEDENVISSNSSGLININTASANELMSLPGIGQVYAQRIIDYRSSKLFSSIEEITNVDGIGEKTFNKMKDLITIN